VIKTISAFQEGQDLVGILNRRFSPDLRIGARAEPLGQVRADLKFPCNRRQLQRLRIGVDDEKLDAGEVCRQHPVHRVGSTAPDPDHLDLGHMPGIDLHLERHPRLLR